MVAVELRGVRAVGADLGADGDERRGGGRSGAGRRVLEMISRSGTRGPTERIHGGGGRQAQDRDRVVKAGELERDVKLGRGGFARSVSGAGTPAAACGPAAFSANRQTLGAREAGEYACWAGEALALADACSSCATSSIGCRWGHSQTHTVPVGAGSAAAGSVMGFGDIGGFRRLAGARRVRQTRPAGRSEAPAGGSGLRQIRRRERWAPGDPPV